MVNNISIDDLLNFFRNKRYKEKKTKSLDNLKSEKITSLMDYYKKVQYPSNQEIWELSNTLDLPHKFVASWFTSQRLIFKNKQNIKF